LLIPPGIDLTWYAALRDTPRNFAYRVRRIAAALWKFLRLCDAHDYAGRCGFRLDASMAPQQVHPTLERAAIKSSLFLNFPVADRRTAQDPAQVALLVSLPQDDPAAEPQGRAHSPMVPRLEKHAAQSRAIVFASHHLAADC
jgi:hypothetical protein